MIRRLISYQTKPESTEENAGLIQNVFRELHAAAPEGVGYLALRAPDGTFYHIVQYEDVAANDRLTDLPAFDAFRKGGADRRTGEPITIDVEIVGNYNMLPTPVTA